MTIVKKRYQEMKVLLVGVQWHGGLELSYFNAFQKLKCDVDCFDTDAEYERISWLKGNRILSKISRKILGQYFAKLMNERLVEKATAFQPDLVFVLKGVLIFPETLRRIKENTNALLFNFNPDSPFNPVNSSRYLLDSLTIYDCLFIWGRFLIPELWQVGARRVEYLPFAHDPELHYPVSVTDEEKERYGSDIVFIGTWDKEREKWLEKLLDYDLKIWGNSWEKLKWASSLRQMWMRKPVIREEFAKVCCSSKIVLNFIRVQNGSAHNMRTFEVPACQGFLLTERTKEQTEFFEEGEEVACFGNVEELREQIERYLNDEESRERIALVARKKVSQHTYERRAERILNVFEDETRQKSQNRSRGIK